MMAFIAAAVAAAGVVVAMAQLRWNQRDSRRRQTLEYLRGVVRLVQRCREDEFARAQRDALTFYRRGCDRLSDAGWNHLLLLDEMDLFALGMAKGAVDREIGREYLRSTYGAQVPETIHFINEFRACVGDPELYQHLYDILPTLFPEAPRWATTYSPDAYNPHAR